MEKTLYEVHPGNLTKIMSIVEKQGILWNITLATLDMETGSVYGTKMIACTTNEVAIEYLEDKGYKLSANLGLYGKMYTQEQDNDNIVVRAHLEPETYPNYEGDIMELIQKEMKQNDQN